MVEIEAEGIASTVFSLDANVMYVCQNWPTKMAMVL